MNSTNAEDVKDRKASMMGLYGGTQNYLKIVEECFEKDVLYEDPEFPAGDESVKLGKLTGLEWKRPREIDSNAQFFVSGASRFDIVQGELSDCWFLAAVANLTLNRKLFCKVVPVENSIENNGVCHFRFWQYGQWVDVVIDDRLPTRNGKLVFVQSKMGNEFWSALLEKAYAKLYGSYAALEWGLTTEALQDFTGGITELYNVKGYSDTLYQIMENAFARWSIMGCFIIDMDAPLRGLIKSHAYSITGIKTVELNGKTEEKMQLLRVRNPWGNESEWQGAWRDGSSEWESVSDADKKEMKVNFEADGEFWMSYKDFWRYWETLEICHLSAKGLEESAVGEKLWEETVFEGAWISGASAGGSDYYMDTFANNPQYIMKLPRNEESAVDQKQTVLISLMQKNVRKQRMACRNIGFAIYELPDTEIPPRRLPIKFFKENGNSTKYSKFDYLREVNGRFSLSPGAYVIVPSTKKPNEEREFLLRVFTEGKMEIVESDDTIGFGEVCSKVAEETEDKDGKKKEEAVEHFKTAAGEGEEEINWSNLKEILNKVVSLGKVPKEVCRSMVALVDEKMSGILNLDKFLELWKSVRIWESAFKMYDRDASGNLNSFELRDALDAAGYHINNKVLQALVLRYGDADGHIQFDDFILCAVKLKALIEIFKGKAGNEKAANFLFEEWIQKALYT